MEDFYKPVSRSEPLGFVELMKAAGEVGAEMIRHSPDPLEAGLGTTNISSSLPICEVRDPV